MASHLGKADSSTLTEIIRGRKDAIVEVDDDALGFSEDLPNTDFSKPFEVPPTNGSYTKDMVAAAIASPPSDFKGHYLRFVMFVYATGGTISYKSSDRITYEVAVSWPPAPTGDFLDSTQAVYPASGSPQSGHVS